MIHCRQLSKLYGDKTVLSIEELQIPAGQCFGLVGNNGAGKTTFFRLILDQIRATTGNVAINEQNVARHEEWKHITGAYLDRHMLLGYLTADEYFSLLGDICGITPKELELQLNRYEPLFNNEIRHNGKYIRDLSKGNAKKVGIAAAMLGTKKIVLLDEPFENLDPTSQNRLKRIIREERSRHERTFLLSSHDLTHVTDVCERIVLLEKGRIKHDLNAPRQEMVDVLNAYFNV